MHIVPRRGWLLGAVAALLLWPALVNGLPLVFPDTLDYVTNARDWRLGITRPPGYAWAILPLWHAGGLWAVVVAQALLSAWIVLLTLRVVGAGPIASAAAIGLVVVATAAPLQASWVMADALSAPTLAAAALLVAGWTGLTPWRRAILLAVVTIGAASHQAHVAMILAAAFGAALAVGCWRGAGAAASAALAALAVVVGANWLVFGHADTAAASPVFLLARLAADGLVLPHLPAACAERPEMMLCARAAWLDGRHLDAFLWRPDSPVWSDYHGLEHMRADARAILAHVVPAEWPSILANGLQRALALPAALRFPEADLRPMAEPMMSGLAHQMPELLRAVGASMQLSGALAALPPVRAIPLATGAALILLPLALLSPGPLRGLAAALICGIAGNALVVGLSAEPYDRYQSRIAWLAVPIAVVALAQLRGATASRRPGPSGAARQPAAILPARP